MQQTKTPIYQTAQIRECERLAQERFGIQGDALMQRAGKAAFDFLQRRWPQAQKIAVFCGAGNNGGDGYVLANVAHERGCEVTIWQLGDHGKMSAEAKGAMKVCQQNNIKMAAFNEQTHLEHPDLVVDAICGIGVHSALRDEIIAAIKKMQQSKAPIFSIDVPTGIDANTGEVLGDAVHATATITFIGLKLGLMTGHGVAYAGELIANDLQLPPELFSYVSPVAEKIHMSAYASYLKPRQRDWHKGLSGHILVVGGGPGMSGAPRMAAEAALRVGAGLVTIAAHPESVSAMNAECPELMCHGIASVSELNPLLAKADVIVLGPGLGRSEWAKLMFTRVMDTTLPLVIDADGLNWLAETTLYSDRWILTPHPGEAARLLATTAKDIQADRLSAIKAITKKYGGVCVLKGAGSLVSAPNELPALCDKGNPGMATAGMGDVLSGVIGGLLGQRIPAGDAAKLGVYLHAAAGDLAAKDGERGMVAMDLMPYLRRLVNQP